MRIRPQNLRKRGQFILSLTKTRIRYIALVFSTLLIFAFATGFGIGRFSDTTEVPSGENALASPLQNTPTEAPKQTGALSENIYAVVVRSLPQNTSNQKEMEKTLVSLKKRGFLLAHIEEFVNSDDVRFIRLVAKESVYPSISVANDNIEGMKKRGEIDSGWPLLLK